MHEVWNIEQQKEISEQVLTGDFNIIFLKYILEIISQL